MDDDAFRCGRAWVREIEAAVIEKRTPHLQELTMIVEYVDALEAALVAAHSLMSISGMKMDRIAMAGEAAKRYHKLMKEAQHHSKRCDGPVRVGQLDTQMRPPEPETSVEIDFVDRV